MTREADGTEALVTGDHQGLKDPLWATVNGLDTPGSRCSEQHPWVLLVAEQRLSLLHRIADLDQQGRP